MFNRIAVSPIVPLRPGSRRRHLATRLAALAGIFARRPERLDESSTPHEQLDAMRQRILSRYY